MNRAARRIAQLDQRREIRQLQRRSDPTRPLTFSDGGYRHKPVYCTDPSGGVASRPSNPVGFDCVACGRLVPSSEVERQK